MTRDFDLNDMYEMVKVDVKRLQELTNQTIYEREHQAALKVIQKIPKKAEDAARNGLNNVVVMEIPYPKAREYGEQKKLEPSELESVEKLVYDYCVKNGLKPTAEIIKVHESTDGPFSSYSTHLLIRIHW